MYGKERFQSVCNKEKYSVIKKLCVEDAIYRNNKLRKNERQHK